MSAAAASFLQSAWWARFKGEFGWTAHVSETPLGTLRLLTRRVGPATLAYAPHAFAAPDDLGLAAASAPRDGVAALVALRAAAVTDGRPMLVRWDVPWQRDHADLLPSELVPAPMRIQPPDTVIVGLTDGADACRAAMKSKTRYNVGLAERKGVSVTIHRGEDALSQLGAWYALYRDTAARDRITIHPERYYRRAFELAIGMGTGRAGAVASAAPVDAASVSSAAPHLELLLARHEGDLLGGIITVAWHGVATYLYGATSNYKRNLMASYLLQWEAMRAAIERGDSAYDLFGIPPSDDPAHPMHGLYRFKTGFGGRIVHRVGARDLLLRPVIGRLYRAAEHVRGWYHFSWRKRSGGAA